MTAYTGAEIAARALRYGATPAVARIMGAASMAEGGGDSEAPGDEDAAGTPRSWGPYQIHDVHGLTRAQRCDLDFATRWMLKREFAPAYAEGLRRGYGGELLARWTCMRAERPYGWDGPQSPGLLSPAAEKYADHWRALEEPMPIASYDPETPRVVQDDPWSCSCAATAWFLNSIGIVTDYNTLEQEMLAAGLVDTVNGLLYGNASALAPWLSTRYGLDVQRQPLSWGVVTALAGPGPVAMGGGGWYHWTGVRGLDADGNLRLANPADGWKGIYQTMTPEQFARLGPFHGIYLGTAVATEEDPAVIDALREQVKDARNLLDNIAGDWIDAVTRAIEDAKTDEDPESRNAKLDAALAAAATIRRRGIPE